jgi:hypothetical protein
MPWVEKIADKLPSWKAALMNRAGRATCHSSEICALSYSGVYPGRYQCPQVVYQID